MTLLSKQVSSSNPGKFYEVRMSEDGKNTIYCDCWVWKRKRGCKHIDKYLMRNSKILPPILFPYAKQVPQHDYMTLQDIVDIEVKKLSP